MKIKIESCISDTVCCIIFIAEKVSLKQAELFTKFVVRILYLKVHANPGSKGFKMEMLTLITNLAVDNLTQEDLEALLAKGAA